MENFNQKIQYQAKSIVNKYGEGSLYQKQGKKPQFSFFYDDETGTKKRKTLSIPEGADPQQIKLEFITKTLIKRYELQQEKKKRQLLQETISKDFLEKVDRLVEALPETKKILNTCTKTVSQVLEEYLEYNKSKNIGYTTYTAYRGFGNKICDFLGNKKLTEITVNDIQYAINNLRNYNTDKLLTKGYVSGTISYFKRALKFAKKKGYISSYAELVEDLEMPLNLKETDLNTKFLEYDELAQVLFSVRTNLRFYTIFRILAITGLRSQELLALQIQDINKTNHSLNIRQALKKQEVTENNERRFKVGKTKTISSTRYVPATETVFRLIDEWLKFTEEKGIRKLAIEKGNGDFIFTSYLGDIADRDSIGKEFWEYQRKLKCVPHASPHMMRHCYATYLSRELTPLKLIQQALGHDTKTGSVTEIHYIATDFNYIERIMPFVQKVDDKIDEAYNVYQSAYFQLRIAEEKE